MFWSSEQIRQHLLIFITVCLTSTVCSLILATILSQDQENSTKKQTLQNNALNTLLSIVPWPNISWMPFTLQAALQVLE